MSRVPFNYGDTLVEDATGREYVIDVIGDNTWYKTAQKGLHCTYNGVPVSCKSCIHIDMTQGIEEDEIIMNVCKFHSMALNAETEFCSQFEPNPTDKRFDAAESEG